MRISIQLPFFPGFYETDYEDSDTAYWAIRNELEYYQQDCIYEHPEYRLLTEDDLDFDYRAYEKQVMDDFIDVFQHYAPDFVTAVEFDELDSPRQYNFRNDHLYAFVELADDWKDRMRDFIRDNELYLRDRIKKDWTSYDGFISFMENDLKDWENPLFEEEDARYIGSMIGYMMYLENKDVYNDIMMSVMEDTCAEMYVTISEEAQERMKQAIESGEVQLPDSDQMEIPFEN